MARKNSMVSPGNSELKQGTRCSKMYNIEKFQENDYSKFKSCVSSYKKKLVKKAKEPATYKNILLERIPILNWLPKYKPNFLLPDIVAGLTCGIMNIPQGMGYALLATMPAVNGLYISFFPCLVYTFFGRSPFLAMGGIALVSLLSGTAIDRMVVDYRDTLTANGTNFTDIAQELADYRISVACSLSLLVGIIQMLLGMSGLGILTTYFSDTFISSYTCASAIHVIKSQVKELFGIKNAIRFSGIMNIPLSVVDLGSKMPEANWQTIVISIISIIYLVIFKEYINPWIKRKTKITFPSDLLLVTVATAASHFGNFGENYGVSIVGEVPTGLPKPHLPNVNLWSALVGEAFIIALIAFSLSISMGCLFARRHKQEIDPTQELYAYGIMNMVSSFFQCYPTAASLSRSSVLEASGGKTLLSGIFSATVMIFVILFIGPLFTSLPKACLASIIVVAFKNMLLQTRDFFKLWRENKYECLIWFITFMSVVFIDVDYGLIIGVGISIFLIVIKDQLFQLRNMESYEGRFVDGDFVSNLDSTIRDVNVKILKPQRSLYYVNCDNFQKDIFRLYGFSPLNRIISKDVQQLEVCVDEENVHEQAISFTDPDIILDFSAVNYIDTNGVNMLLQIIKDFKKINIMVYVCEAHDQVIERFYNMKKLAELDDHIYVTVNDALNEISIKVRNSSLTECDKNNLEHRQNETKF